MQDEIWNDVAHKSARMNVASPTAAMHDIYDARRDRLHAICGAMHLHDRQTGALVLIAGRPAVLDYVSRPDVYAALHAPLLQGYALDALEAADAESSPSAGAAEAFLAPVLAARVNEHDGIGLGRDVRLAEAGAAGAGLAAAHELVQLTAFATTASDTPDTEPPRARVRRPSRRRVV